MALRAVRVRRRLADELYSGVMQRLTGEPVPVTAPPTEVNFGPTVERHIERRGSELAHEEVEQWWKAREETTDPHKQIAA